MHTFSIEKLSKKLEKYYELSLEIFLDEVRKKKVDVKSRKNYQTFKNEYEESLAVIKPLLQQIKETDAEIDRMVYELYGLTEDEIQIIENSLF
jgi:effector-binding domain-containing protein